MIKVLASSVVDTVADADTEIVVAVAGAEVVAVVDTEVVAVADAEVVAVVDTVEVVAVAGTEFVAVLDTVENDETSEAETKYSQAFPCPDQNLQRSLEIQN